MYLYFSLTSFYFICIYEYIRYIEMLTRFFVIFYHYTYLIFLSIIKYNKKYLIDFRFALLLNKKFRFTISFQFLVSTLVVCFTLYQLTKTSGKFVELGMYMSCMLTQIFLYCWYGNEVKLKVCAFENFMFSYIVHVLIFK